MHYFFKAEEGYFTLTGAGYYVLAAILLAALILSAVIVDRRQKNTRFSAKRLALCGILIALGFLLSYVKIHLPYGGSMTVFSMLCICLIGYLFGIKAGMLSAFAYSILQFFQSGGTYMLSPLQICCDYFFAFTALGITGFFYRPAEQDGGSAKRFLPAYLAAILLRGLFHAIGGYLYWMDYVPESFPKNLALLYPLIYNYSYILAEGLLTLLVLRLPPVGRLFAQLKRLAAEN